DLCTIEVPGHGPLLAEVVGFQSGRLLLTPMGDVEGVGPGNRVVASRKPMSIPVGEALIGRVIDAMGRPLDGRGALPPMPRARVWRNPPPPLQRQRITRPLSVGVRAIDGLITLGQGQRIGVFAGS